VIDAERQAAIGLYERGVIADEVAAPYRA